MRAISHCLVRNPLCIQEASSTIGKLIVYLHLLIDLSIEVDNALWGKNIRLPYLANLRFLRPLHASAYRFLHMPMLCTQTLRQTNIVICHILASTRNRLRLLDSLRTFIATHFVMRGQDFRGGFGTSRPGNNQTQRWTGLKD